MNVEAPSEGLRSRKKEKTRRAIEDAALELFAEQGYEATTVNQIAERAEVSTATFFRYFGTKQEVIFAEDGNEFAELRRAVVECPAGEDDLERGALRHPRRLGAYARRQAHLPPGPGGGIVTLAAWAEFRSRSALATRHQRGARAASRARRPGPAMRAGGHRRVRGAEQRRQCLGPGAGCSGDLGIAIDQAFALLARLGTEFRMHADGADAEPADASGRRETRAR